VYKSIFIISFISKELNILINNDLDLRVGLVFDYSIGVKFNNDKNIWNYQSIIYVMVENEL